MKWEIKQTRYAEKVILVVGDFIYSAGSWVGETDHLPMGQYRTDARRVVRKENTVDWSSLALCQSSVCWAHKKKTTKLSIKGGVGGRRRRCVVSIIQLYIFVRKKVGPFGVWQMEEIWFIPQIGVVDSRACVVASGHGEVVWIIYGGELINFCTLCFSEASKVLVYFVDAVNLINNSS